MWKITYKKKASFPRYQQIVQLVEFYIEQGKLSGGQKLPGERDLAQLLKVNRTTIIRALEELTERGILIRKRGSGTFVNADKWGLQSRVVFTWRLAPNRQKKNWTMSPSLAKKIFLKLNSYREGQNDSQLDFFQYSLQQSNLSTRQLFTQRSLRSTHNTSVKKQEMFQNLSRDHLAEDLLPTLSLPETSWKELIKEGQNLPPEATFLGFSSLRKTIKTFLLRYHGLEVSEDQILVTSGIQQAIFLTTQCLLRPGDAIGIESPSYFYSLPVFQAAGLRLCGLPMDDEGITIEGLERQIFSRRLKMVFLNPVFHNPTGRVMSSKRKKEILELCEASGVPIFEDDAYSLLAFDPGLDVTPLKRWDKNNRVIYSSSLSSYIGHRLRIGWMVAPEPVVNILGEARHHIGSGVSILPQTLARIYLEKNFPSHRLDIWENLSLRANSLYQLLEEKYADTLTITPPQGGLYLYAEMKNRPRRGQTMSAIESELAIKKLLDDLKKDGLSGAEGTMFGADKNTIRFNFSGFMA